MNVDKINFRGCDHVGCIRSRILNTKRSNDKNCRRETAEIPISTLLGTTTLFWAVDPRSAIDNTCNKCIESKKMSPLIKIYLYQAVPNVFMTAKGIIQYTYYSYSVWCCFEVGRYRGDKSGPECAQ